MLRLLILLLSLTMISGCAPGSWKAASLPPEMLTKEFTPEELKEDLAFLLDTLEAVHPNLYAFTGKTEIEQQAAIVREKLASPMTRLEFYQLLAPLVAGFKDGHTTAAPPAEELNKHINEGGLFFPCAIELQDGEVIIRRSLVEPHILPGWRLVSLNNVPAEDLIAGMAACVSAEKESFRQAIIENRFTEFLWTISGLTGPFSATFETPEGESTTVAIPGLTAEQIRESSPRETGSAGDAYYSFYTLPDENTAVIDFRSFTDLNRFKVFLQESFREIEEKEIENLIIDLRRNGGGNSQLGDALLMYLTDQPFRQFSRIDIKISPQIKKHYGVWPPFWLKKNGTVWSQEGTFIQPGQNKLRFHGRVFVLTGPNTFSSATDFAATIKDFGLGTIVGEETGGLATCYGDIYSFQLPHTKLRCGVSHKYFVRPSGEDDGRGVLPDYEVKSSDTPHAGRDEVMEFTLQLIRDSN